MEDSWSYIKVSIGKIPEGAYLVTGDVTGLYPSLPNGAGLEVHRKKINERDSPKVPTDDIVRMKDFVIKNTFFEFNGEVKRQISGTDIGAKFAPRYACIFMDKVKAEFLKNQELQPSL